MLTINPIRFVFISAMLSAMSACSGASAPSSAANAGSAAIPAQVNEAAIQVEIKQLIDDYAIARDNADGKAYANVFAKDGIFHFGGEIFQGREAIEARVNDAPPSGKSFHYLSTSQVEIENATRATGMHYGTVYSANLNDTASEGLQPFIGRVIRGRYHDKYRLTDEGWKIAERRFEPVFVNEVKE